MRFVEQILVIKISDQKYIFSSKHAMNMNLGSLGIALVIVASSGCFNSDDTVLTTKHEENRYKSWNSGQGYL